MNEVEKVKNYLLEREEVFRKKNSKGKDAKYHCPLPIIIRDLGPCYNLAWFRQHKDEFIVWNASNAGYQYKFYIRVKE